MKIDLMGASMWKQGERKKVVKKLRVMEENLWLIHVAC